MKILIATFNKGKQLEHKGILLRLAKKTNKDLTIVLPEDLGIRDKVEETGKTFEDNSLLKAKLYFERSGVPAIADDGGLEIPVLNNEPGVLSRRWLGYEADDEKLITYTLKRLEKYKRKEDRRAYLTVCVTYYDGKRMFQETEKIDGYIAEKASPNYIKGYPFRALFIVLPLEKYLDKLTTEEHAKYNHREKALSRLWEKIVFMYNK